MLGIKLFQIKKCPTKNKKQLHAALLLTRTKTSGNSLQISKDIVAIGNPDLRKASHRGSK